MENSYSSTKPALRPPAFLLALLPFIFAGCGHMRTAIHSDWMDQPEPKMAVFPLVGGDVFSGPIFGEGIADALVTELINKGYPVMERGSLKRIMEEHRLQYTGAFDRASINELGRLSGVDTIVLGSLTTRETVSAFEYLLGNGVGRVQIDVVRLKWVDVGSGQIMASVTVKNPRGGTPDDVARKVMRGLDQKIRLLSKSPTDNRKEIHVRSVPTRQAYAFHQAHLPRPPLSRDQVRGGLAR